METKKTKKMEGVKPKAKPTPMKAKASAKVDVDNSLHLKMINLETAYINAITGKIKFAEVKSIFKKLHKEIKETSKK